MLKYFKYIFDGTRHVYKNYDVNSFLNKHDLMDPFTVIVNLALLKFKENGTKLKISNKTLSIDDKFIIQNISRTFTGQNKTDLKLLYEPIIEACTFFLIESNDFTIFPIFEYACEGLKKLKLTYNNFDDVKHLLNIYENIIRKSFKQNLGRF